MYCIVTVVRFVIILIKFYVCMYHVCTSSAFSAPVVYGEINDGEVVDDVVTFASWRNIVFVAQLC